MQTACRYGALAVWAVWMLATPALAAEPVRAAGQQQAPGPNFGTSPEEEANRQVVFAWAKMMRIDRQKSYQMYMDVEKYVEHPERGGIRPQDNSGPSQQMPEPQPTAEGRIGQIKFGDKLSAQDTRMVAHVDGAMVTLYWPGGVDLFRVENGKIVSHWTASPPGTVTIYGPEDSRAPPMRTDAPDQDAVPR